MGDVYFGQFVENSLPRCRRERNWSSRSVGGNQRRRTGGHKPGDIALSGTYELDVVTCIVEPAPKPDDLILNAAGQ